MKPSDSISVRVRRNKNKAIRSLVLSFRSRKAENRKRQFIQSNMFDEKVVSLEIMGILYSVMLGENENHEEAYYIVRHSS